MSPELAGAVIGAVSTGIVVVIGAVGLLLYKQRPAAMAKNATTDAKKAKDNQKLEHDAKDYAFGQLQKLFSELKDEVGKLRSEHVQGQKELAVALVKLHDTQQNLLGVQDQHKECQDELAVTRKRLHETELQLEKQSYEVDQLRARIVVLERAISAESH